MINQPPHFHHKINKDPKCELYISNLEEEISEQILFNIFSVYGHIIGVKIMRHLLSRKSRGFAFITYKNQKSAEKALKDMNGKVIFRNKIKVFSKEKYQKIDKNSNVYFTNLPKQMTQEEFEEMVSEIGPVFSIKFNEVENDEFNSAYVQYENNGDGDNAIGILNDKEVHGVKINVATTSKNNIIFIKGRESPTIMQEIQELTQPYGEVIFSEKLVSQNNVDYILSLRFTSEQKARSFVLDISSKLGDDFPIKFVK